MNRLYYYFAHPEVFWLLPSLALAWLAVLWGRRQKRRAVRLLGQTAAVHKLLRTSPRSRRFSGLCLFLGLLLLLVGAAGPRWGWDVPRDTVKEHDVVIVLDVSRSMLAEVPTRLERALRALEDLAEHLQERGGQRLALIVFAARPRLVFPLTRDYDHFRVALEDIRSGDLPADVYPGGDDSPDSGTCIGAALALAAESFDQATRAPRAALLLSDGDDPFPDREEWRQGVHAARAARVVVHTVGVGDPSQESVIMIPGRDKTKARVGEVPLQYEGKDVKTKLHEKVLQDIAESTGGVYLPARTSRFPLGSMLPDILVKQAETADSTLTQVPVQQPRHAWFLWPALLLLSATLLFRERPGSRRQPAAANRQPAGSASAVLARCLLLLVAAAALGQVGAFSLEDDWIREGNAAAEQGDLEAALSLYEKAEAGTTDPGLVAFNKAAVLYRLKRYREAELHYLRCLEDRQAPPARQAQALFNLGTALMRQAENKNVANLERAIDAFATCLSQQGLSPQLAADAQYNLELARWLRFQAAPPEKSPGENGSEPPPQQKNKDKKKDKGKSDSSSVDSKGGDDGRKQEPGNSPGDPKSDQTLGQKFANPGNLHNLLDAEADVRFAPEDIAAFLEETVQRIREQRRSQAGHRPGAGPHVKDW